MARLLSALHRDHITEHEREHPTFYSGFDSD